jgi:hypothetical protein
LIETNNFEKGSDVQALEHPNNDDISSSEKFSITEGAVASKSDFNSHSHNDFGTFEISSDTEEMIATNNEKCYESSSEDSLDLLKMCEQTLGPLA